MSLQALSQRAVWRDTAPPLPPLGTTAGEPVGGGEPVEATGPAVAAAQLQKATNALTTAIPTEVLGPYTAIVAIIVANSSRFDSLAALRWWTYGVSMAFIVVYEFVTYRRSSTTKRRLPWVELSGALIAFAAWALAMPGSPLTISVHAADFAIASAMIAIGGAALLGLISFPLNAKSTKAV